MELQNQIKKYRKIINLSQEELAQKIYVSRQTISNWENGKSYPDIHSLLLLSSLFNVSLDQLIKGDLDIMQKEIKKDEQKKFNATSYIFTLLLLITILTFIPLIKFLKIYGIIISIILYVITFIYSIKVEKLKKANNIQTYKEIIAFTKGEYLNESERNQEYAKRPYQKILLALLFSLITFCIVMFLNWLI